MNKLIPEAIPRLGAIFYNRLPAKAFRNFYRDVAKEINKEIQSGRILDIGTGPGYLPIELAKLNFNLDILGIDLSSKMVDIARENAKRAKAKNVAFEVADANELPYENNSFDFILSTGALHHWHNVKKVFHNIKSILKENGTCWIYDLRRDASRDEIRNTLKRPDSSLRYMRWAFKFHGLKTREYFDQIRPILKEISVGNFNMEEKNAMMKISWRR